MTSILARYGMPVAQFTPSIGDTKTSIVDADHGGWLKCDGRELSVAKYKKLFNLVGYTFGGSGEHFRLPAPAGHVMGIAGPETENTSARTIGEIVGEETHTLIVAEMPAHDHTGNTGISGEHIHPLQNTATVQKAGGNTPGSIDAGGNEINCVDTLTVTMSSAGSHRHTISSQGGSDPHNNMQPTMFIGHLYVYSGEPEFNMYHHYGTVQSYYQ
jgi:microcystin-dependent protein